MAHASRGFALLDADRYKRALGAFARAARPEPRPSDAHAGRGHALLGMEMNKRALGAFTRAARLDPGNAAAQRGRAEALHRLGRPKRALAAVDRAVAAAPRMTRAHLVRSSILYGMGRTGEAVAACEEAARLDPDDRDIAEALGDLRRGRQPRDPDRAWRGGGGGARQEKRPPVQGGRLVGTGPAGLTCRTETLPRLPGPTNLEDALDNECEQCTARCAGGDLPVQGAGPGADRQQYCSRVRLWTGRPSGGRHWDALPPPFSEDGHPASSAGGRRPHAASQGRRGDRCS